MVTATCILLISLGVLLGTVGNLSHKSYLAALLVAGLMAGTMFRLYKKYPHCTIFPEKESALVMCVILSSFCLFLNGVWVFSFHPVQAADYRTFFTAASDLANDRPLSGADYIAMFPHILGYSVFLSGFFRLFGENLMTAALVNVILTTLTGVILYMLCLKYNGQTAAFMSFLLWALCPSKLLYNTMSLSEPFYTFLLLLFFLITFEIVEPGIKEENSCKTLASGLLSGFVLAMVNAARPIGIIPIIAFFLWLFFLSDWQNILNRRKTFLIFSCMLLLAYFGAGRVWNAYAAEKLGQSLPSVPGYNIYVGFNPETQGSYADEDMEMFQSLYFGEFDRNAEAAQQSMLHRARERVFENRNSIPGLMNHKLGTLLGHDEGGAFYSRESLSAGAYSFWCIVSNIWYYFVCILAVTGGLKNWRKPTGNVMYIVSLCLIGIILAQLLVEVAARYHYCLIPMLLILASTVLKKRHPPID